MLLRHPGSLVGMFQKPAAEDFAIRAFSGVRPVVPWIVAAEPKTPQILVISWAFMRCAGMQPVVAIKRFEAALRDAQAKIRGRIDAKARDTRRVGTHMRLADQHRMDAERLQMLAKRGLAHPQRILVPVRTVGAHIAPGVEAHACRTADRGLHVSTGEAHTAARQSVNVWRANGRMPVAAQVVEPELIAHDPQNVPRPTHLPIIPRIREARVPRLYGLGSRSSVSGTPCCCASMRVA